MRRNIQHPDLTALNRPHRPVNHPGHLPALDRFKTQVADTADLGAGAFAGLVDQPRKLRAAEGLVLGIGQQTHRQGIALTGLDFDMVVLAKSKRDSPLFTSARNRAL